MKKVLIISAHFPPSNLAAVHRSRLFAQHLPTFGWEPVILTVDEKYYEEKLDLKLLTLVPRHIEIIKADAFRVTKPRIVGDIGLRGFLQLYKKAKEIIINYQIDFLYIPIPSFYVALLGRYLHEKTGIKYGIDYIDPWVHVFPGSEKFLSRHWWSSKVSKFLEPIALKKASLVTGVAEGYYQGVLERNPLLIDKIIFGAMPYGGEKTDHVQIKSLNLEPYLFAKKNKVQLVYAGAMLPKAYAPLEEIFKILEVHRYNLEFLEFHFIGTGRFINGKNEFSIKHLAEKYNIWNSIIFEYPERIPYLDVLIHLEAASGVFILGSTEPHYTPSKVYQAVLAEKPILAVLHERSTAVEVINNSNAGIVLKFNGTSGLDTIHQTFYETLLKYFNFLENFDVFNIKNEMFEAYSAKEVTRMLVELIEKVK